MRNLPQYFDEAHHGQRIRPLEQLYSGPLHRGTTDADESEIWTQRSKCAGKACSVQVARCFSGDDEHFAHGVALRR